MTLAPPANSQPITWRLGTVVENRPETARTRTLVLDVPGWPGHRAGQHVDVRLTAEDGYRTERSYSIASPPEEAHLSLTVERLEEGEVSPYLADELRAGDTLELRGPIGGYFVWDADDDAASPRRRAGGRGRRGSAPRQRASALLVARLGGGDLP
jgi:ferredoxin-NADP reductase